MPELYDDWKPSASFAELRRRGELLREIRNYFHAHRVLEVETPMLSSAATVDPHIDSFKTDFCPIGTRDRQSIYLHTSPEFPMKRLLAAGSEDIYYLGRVFRNGEAGEHHNPEFTMLEWYRLGIDHHALMDDVSALLATVTNFLEVERYSYQQLFEQYFSINPHTVSDHELEYLIHDKVDASLQSLARNDYLDLLFSTVIEPNLGVGGDERLEGVYVYDFPASMSALSRIITNGNGQQVAARFELFINGIELANGYHELADSEEQNERFRNNQEVRKVLGSPVYPYDQRMVSALKSEFPDCAGVAMGIDRLHMLMAQAKQIADVLAFDFARA